MSKFSELFPALVECFAIILLGYISGRLNIITAKQGEGLGKFVGLFALPALLFKSMVELDFNTVSWSFMVAVLIAKSIVFLTVLTFSLLMLKTNTLARGALYSIFTTQSNDFALGYPLVQALYAETHKEFLQYIYLVAPISMLILNPIGFVLLEIDKHRIKEQEYVVIENNGTSNDNFDKSLQIGESLDVVDEDIMDSESDEREIVKADEVKGFTSRSCLNVAKGVLLNPIVFMVFIGLAGHFIFRGKLPAIIGDALGTLGKAFSGAALFYLGLTMVGKISQQKGGGLLLTTALIAAKILLMPVLIREFMLLLSNVLPVYCPPGIARNSTNMTEYVYMLADFGYLYGTFPTAPTVVIYAARYGIEMDRLASGMVFCTSLSAPIMYISAWTLSMTSMSSQYFQSEVKAVNKDISIITLFCAVWCIIIFFVGRKFAKVPHIVTLGYVFSLFISSLGTIFWDGFGNNSGNSNSTQLFLFGMMFFGVKSARLLTASIAVALLAALSKGQRWLWNYCWWFIITPYVISFLATVILMSTNKMNATESDGVFAYGKSQDVTSLVILSFSFIITVLCLIAVLKVHGYHDKKDDKDQSTPLIPHINSDLSSSDDDSTSNSEDKRISCCVSRTRCNFGDVQKVRHIVLLILLTLSMFIGISLVLWRLTGNPQAGVYFEVAFLDSVFNFGQGIFVFCVFGLDSDLIIDPFVRFYHKLRYGSEDINLPDLDNMDKATLMQCLQFTRYHLDDCKLDIVSDKRSGLKIYPGVFTGTDFCSWVVERGLVNERTEAVAYGQNLLLGRVIIHHTNKHYFYDRNFLYMFEEPKTCYKIMHKHISRSDSPYRSSPAGTSSANVPTTSSRLEIRSPVRMPGTPVKRSYFGFSFEAYLTVSDAEGPYGSYRKYLKAKMGSFSDSTNTETSASVNNNSNNSDSTIETLNEHVQQRKPLKKIFPKPQMTHDSSANSDSSY